MEFAVHAQANLRGSGGLMSLASSPSLPSMGRAARPSAEPGGVKTTSRLTFAGLAAMAEIVVGEDDGHHGFADGHGADAHT